MRQRYRHCRFGVWDRVRHVLALEPALERAKGGLGIGLALVRGIVELHGGSIAAGSAGPGQGSRFTVRIPLASDPVDPTEVPDSDDVPAQVRVLVVDDNQDAAKTLEMALEVLGCDAKVAHTAVEALEVARLFRPTVALLDIGLRSIAACRSTSMDADFTGLMPYHGRMGTTTSL